MRRTTLGTGGPEVGVIGLGAMGMSYAYDPAARHDPTSLRVIRQALDLGVTLIDTADVYGPFTNETLVGRALAGRRDEAVVSTKGGVRDDGGTISLDGTPRHLRSALESSLRRLDVDHVDLYLLHRVDPAVPLEESWGALAELVSEGKARHIGLSEPTVDEVIRAGEVHPVQVVQSELSLFTRDHMPTVVPYCLEQGIGFMCHSPLAAGLLSGRFRAPSDVAPSDDRAAMPRFAAAAMQANQALMARVATVAGRIGATSSQVALAWLLAQGRSVVPIPGTKTPRYLLENAGAADLHLSATDLAELDALPPPVGARE